MMMNRLFLWLLFGAGLVWLFRRPLEQFYLSRKTGLTAAVDAATLNGYTTYNTQIYTPPTWQPLLNFFKAGAYVPSPTNGAAGGQSVDYSVQG